MSHTVKVAVSLSNREFLEAAREKLNLPAFKEGRHQLYDGTQMNGLALQLPNWRYPIVIDIAKGEAKYDNYGGTWGKQVELDKLCQAYAVEAGRSSFASQGYTVVEELQPDQAIKLVATAY